MSDDNVARCLGRRAQKTIEEAQHVGEGKGKDKKTGKSLAEEIPEADRLGPGTGSLSAYIEDPKKWGENRAAWQWLAVDNMPGQVGARINSVATSSGGTALAGPVVRARVDAELAKDPKPAEEDRQDGRGQEQRQRDRLRRQHLRDVSAAVSVGRDGGVPIFDEAGLAHDPEEAVGVRLGEHERRMVEPEEDPAAAVER